MHDIEKHLDTKRFKCEFWKWWDSLPKHMRSKFMYYRDDMADMYFYNQVYIHKIQPEHRNFNK